MVAEEEVVLGRYLEAPPVVGGRGVWRLERGAVDEDLSATKLHLLSRQSDDPLEDPAADLGRIEDHEVTAPDPRPRTQHPRPHPLSVMERGLHGSGIDAGEPQRPAHGSVPVMGGPLSVMATVMVMVVFTLRVLEVVAVPGHVVASGLQLIGVKALLRHRNIVATLQLGTGSSAMSCRSGSKFPS